MVKVTNNKPQGTFSDVYLHLTQHFCFASSFLLLIQLFSASEAAICKALDIKNSPCQAYSLFLPFDSLKSNAS